MLRLTKTKKIVITLAVAAAVVAGSGAAYAYWSTTGTGSGTVSAVAAAIPVTAVQTSNITTLAPGVLPQTLSGKFNNTNTGPVFVATVTASITGVTGAGCTASDYTLATPIMTVGHEIAVSSNVDAWTGATIAFNDKGTNQDFCKGSVVTLTYTVA